MRCSGVERSIVVAGLLGVLVSTYALYVEMAAEARPGYKAFCDFSERASCSRVLTSKYSKGFGFMPKEAAQIPNCIFGTIFYCLIIFLTTFDKRWVLQLQYLLAWGSVATSVYLAYLLIFVLRDFCLVCITSYVINGALVFLLRKKINQPTCGRIRYADKRE